MDSFGLPKGTVANWLKSSTDYMKLGVANLGATLSQDQLLKWWESFTDGSATLYDKALDKSYIEGLSGGGGNHRLFDGGHDIFGAWDRAKDAVSDDSFAEEVLGYASAIWKDVTTLKGLPFATLEKASYDEWADKISSWIPGVSKEYLYDLCSFDAMEITSSTLGFAGAVFCFKKEDYKRLSEILGAMGVVSITSANPILGLITVLVTAYSYFIKKRQLDKSAVFKSGTVAAFSALIFTALGLPFLIEFGVVLVLSNILKKKILSNDELMTKLSVYAQTAAVHSKDLTSIGVETLIRVLEGVSRSVSQSRRSA